MEEWKEYRLGDIIKISSGFAYKGEYLGYGDKYLLGMGCVSFNEQFLDKGVRPYSGECDNRFYAKAGDIVLATRQQSDNMPILGMPAVIPYKYKDRKLIVGANLYRIINESKDFGNDFIYWLLKDPRYVNYIKSCQSGTTVRMITKANIENYTFVCPNKKSRLLISRFLWTLEKKIELNRRINENLEQQAQALFKSWFVDFEPFKDGKFVDSELGMIPEGWKVGQISDFGKIICGKTPSKASKDFFGGNIPFIKIPDMHNQLFILHSEDSLSYKGSSSQQNKLLPPYSLLVSCIATVGLVSINTKPSHTNQQINSIVPYKSSYLFYLYLSLILMKKKLENMGRGGTATLNVNTTSFGKISLIIPKQSILDNFSSIVSPLFKNIENLSEQIFKLSQLRDTLLPRLMSGELKISNIDNKNLQE